MPVALRSVKCPALLNRRARQEDNESGWCLILGGGFALAGMFIGSITIVLCGIALVLVGNYTKPEKVE